MKQSRETLHRDKELKEFQNEMKDIIHTQREKGEQADFDSKIKIEELTHTDMGMYRHVQELQQHGMDINSLKKLEKEFTFIKRYKQEVRTSKNSSRDMFMQWIVNQANALLMHIEEALEKLPAFQEKMRLLVRDEFRKKRLKKEYEQSFNDPLDVQELLPSDMRIYEWIQSLKEMAPEQVAQITQEDFEKFRTIYFQYFNNVPKNNKSRRTFVHYVGNLVTSILSELELRTMYPEDFQK